MRIQLAGLSGSFMGRAFDFPQQPVVTLGRNPQNNVAADPPREPMVSDKHAEIYEERGGIFIRDLNSTNGTYINGQRIALPTLLMPGMTLRLGGAGPELQILTLALEQGAPGMGQPAGFGAPAPQPQPWGAPPAPSPYPAPQTPQPAHAGAHPHGMDLAMPGLNAPPPYPVGGAKQGIGLMTLQREISNAKAEVRFEEGKKRRAALVVLSMVLLVGMIISVVVWAVIGSKIEANFEAVAEKHKYAIYLVVCKWVVPAGKNEKGEDMVMIHTSKGTAFAINKEKGLLGTNAHVTETVKEALNHNGIALVVCNSKPECLYKIKKGISHPKYTGKITSIAQSPDVGIIEADLNTAKGFVPMPDAMQPGSQEELKLETGKKIALMGYPGIEQFDAQYIRADSNGDNFEGVVAKFSEGQVSNIMTFDFKPWPAKDASNYEVLEHTIQAFHGNSGSPIFNTNGNVVALLNSGPTTTVMGKDNKEIELGRGLQSYGINVRFLQELVEQEYPGAWK